MDEIVFIILRHVNSKITNKYWQKSYRSIRKFYPDDIIIIIDDNSSYQISTKLKLTNCETINSKYPQRGELLPYYYFYRYRWAKKAIILHDSVFINSKLPVDDIKDYKFLWDFKHKYDRDDETINILSQLFPNDIVPFYLEKDKWYGCFGAMSVISWELIYRIEFTFNFFPTMLQNITDRAKRMCFERIIACVCTYLVGIKPAVFGDIHQWCLMVTNNKQRFNITYDTYLKNKSQYKKLPIMKVWSGR